MVDDSRMYVSWNEIEDLVNGLYERLKDENIDKVVGIARGGLIPAVNLSHYYDCKLYTLNISLRDGKAPKSKFRWQDVYK